MLLNYCKIAWRNITRHKIFSTINIAGLAFSIAAFILIALYIENELSYDRFNQKADRIYRVVDDKKTPDVLLRGVSSVASVVLAFPAGWWLISLWLQNYAYRIEPEWWVFVVAGLLVIFIAFVTVSFQALRSE